MVGGVYSINNIWYFEKFVDQIIIIIKKVDIIISIQQDLISNQQSIGQIQKHGDGGKIISSKCIPTWSLLQMLCQPPSSHFSAVICNKHVTRGNCKLQTIWPCSTEYGVARFHPVEAGSGHKGQHLLYWAYSRMEAEDSCKSQGTQHGLRGLQTSSDTPARPWRKLSLK